MYKALLFQIAASAVAVFFFLYFFFGPPAGTKETEIFVVPKATENFDGAGELRKQGFVRSAWITRLIIAGRSIEPGGYRITKSMWVWQITDTLTRKPSLLWVTISGC